ncbi:MAG: hypothetical protein N3E51_01930 [Candidatus Micrarchaeota archaeon]|nr:hypothetical protein [Candidatus Micrarchaeota archaeon]
MNALNQKIGQSAESAAYFGKTKANQELVRRMFMHLKERNYAALEEMHKKGLLPKDYLLHITVKFLADTNERNSDASHVRELMRIGGISEREIYEHAKQLANLKLERGKPQRALEYLQVVFKYADTESHQVSCDAQKMHADAIELRDKIEYCLSQK